MNNNELVKSKGSALLVERDEEQLYYERVERMKQFRQDPMLALSHDIVRKSDGSFMLMKLSDAKCVMEQNGNSSGSFVQGYSGMVGLNKMRGKYGDENRLFDQDSASLKVGEVAAWSTL